MRPLLVPLVCLLLLAAPGLSADPPKPEPPKPAPTAPAVVILPPDPVVPPPPPPLATTLPAEALYVIRSEIACTVIASPDGMVKVAAETGPVKIRAIFVGGNGKYECKTFTEKHVWTVEAVQTGKCELIIIPGDGSATLRRMLDVTVGPPTPPPPPPPPPPIDALTKALQAAYDTDPDPAKSDHIATLGGILPKVVANGKATGELVRIKDLHDYIYGYVDTVVGTGTLPSVRKVASEYVAKKMPATDGPLTDALYSSAAAACQDVATAIGNVRRGK